MGISCVPMSLILAKERTRDISRSFLIGQELAQPWIEFGHCILLASGQGGRKPGHSAESGNDKSLKASNEVFIKRWQHHHSVAMEISHAQFESNANFIFVSFELLKFGHYKRLHMTLQLCCHGMCKFCDDPVHIKWNLLKCYALVLEMWLKSYGLVRTLHCISRVLHVTEKHVDSSTT